MLFDACRGADGAGGFEKPPRGPPELGWVGLTGIVGGAVGLANIAEEDAGGALLCDFDDVAVPEGVFDVLRPCVDAPENPPAFVVDGTLGAFAGLGVAPPKKPPPVDGFLGGVLLGGCGATGVDRPNSPFPTDGGGLLGGFWGTGAERPNKPFPLKVLLEDELLGGLRRAARQQQHRSSRSPSLQCLV